MHNRSKRPLYGNVNANFEQLVQELIKRLNRVIDR